MNLFNQGWWNCFISYTENILFANKSQIDIVLKQMNEAGVSLAEIDNVRRAGLELSETITYVLKEYIKKEKNE